VARAASSGQGSSGLRRRLAGTFVLPRRPRTSTSARAWRCSPSSPRSPPTGSLLQLSPDSLAGVTFLRANRRDPCPLVEGGVELRRAPELEVRHRRLARDLPVAHPSCVARGPGNRPLAPRAANTCVHGGVGAVDGLPGAAGAPACPGIVVASGLMNTMPPLDTAAARLVSSSAPSLRGCSDEGP
jgi:hypothetical protein